MKSILIQLARYYSAGMVGSAISVPLTYLMTSSLGIFYLWSSIIAGQIPGLIVFFVRRRTLNFSINPSITKELNR